MSGFTPGPWDLSVAEGGYGYVISYDGGSMVHVWPRDLRNRDLPDKANAHLIAAAPNMYQAHQKTVDDLEYYIGNPSAWGDFDEGVSEKLRAVVTRAKAAIAKARGES